MRVDVTGYSEELNSLMTFEVIDASSARVDLTIRGKGSGYLPDLMVNGVVTGSFDPRSPWRLRSDKTGGSTRILLDFFYGNQWVPFQLTDVGAATFTSATVLLAASFQSPSMMPAQFDNLDACPP